MRVSAIRTIPREHEPLPSGSRLRDVAIPSSDDPARAFGGLGGPCGTPLPRLLLAIGAESPADHIRANYREALTPIDGDRVHVEVDVLDAAARQTDHVMMRTNRCVKAGRSRPSTMLLHLPHRYQGMQSLINGLQRYGR